MIDNQVTPLVFLLNGEIVSLEINPEMTALDLLHDTLNMSGTKEGCKEGDCGACTIAVGTLDEHESICFKAINSCIFPALKLHGTHVITIEGLKSQGTLHIIQQHIVNEHGIQCGFCSPGIILSFFALFASNPHPTIKEIEIALSGNICRCTGYEGIRDAGKAVTLHLEGLDNQKVESLIVPEYVLATIDTLKHIPSQVGVSSYQIPKSISDYELIASSLDSYSIQCGATDLQVRRNLTVSHDSETIVDISQIAELHEMKVEENRLIIGSSLTITTIMEHELMLQFFPEMRECALVMASTQIRNVASVAGNIANASPIGDASIFFLALNADLTIYRAQTKIMETLPLSSFFISYKKTKLNPKDLICSLSIPIIEDKKGCKHITTFHKTSKRKQVDIATVNSGSHMEVCEGVITSWTLSFGGVGPIPLSATHNSLSIPLKIDLSIEELEGIASQFVFDASPISDVRGSMEYRKLLMKNHIIHHYIHSAEVYVQEVQV